jgi:ferredoxin
MENRILYNNIKKLADSQGIDVLGFTNASEFKGSLLRNSKRRNPRLSLPEANTIIIAGIYIGGLVLPSWDKSHYGRTSRLFLSGFFSDVIKQIEPISTLLMREGYSALICDSSKSSGSILPLKLAAVKAGFGWQGKHSLLISSQYGTFLALGGIVTNANLDHNIIEETDRCKNCKICQEACPVNALEKSYVLNRDRCLSSILQNNDIPEEASKVLGNQIMDCEICQEVCPWNAKHIKQPLNTQMTLSFQKKIAGWEDYFRLSQLVKLTQEKYKKTLGHLNTGIPFSIFYRNILMAIERFQNH